MQIEGIRLSKIMLLIHRENLHAGRRARRAIFGEDGDVEGFGDATVVGFLPARLSEFKSDFTNRPAALWRIRYIIQAIVCAAD